MENLEIYVIKKCNYCLLLKKLLNEFKIKHLVNNVKENEKDKYKNKNIKTFPQVYYVYNKKKILIGGYSDFTKILSDVLDKVDIDKIRINNKNKKNRLRIYKYLIGSLNI